MKTFPLSQLDTLPNKSPLGSVAGTAKRIFQRKTGTKQNGDQWSKQDFELIDAEDVLVKVVVWDKDEIPRSNEGCKVTLFAKESDKGPSGLYVFDDEYPKGTLTRKLKMTPTGLIQFEGRQQEPETASQASEPESAQSHASEPREEPREQSSQARAPRKEPDPVLEAKLELMKLANLHILATLTVEKVIAPKFKEATGREMPEDRRGASVSSLIIAGEKRGLHLNLPSKSIEI